MEIRIADASGVETEKDLIGSRLGDGDVVYDDGEIGAGVYD